MKTRQALFPVWAVCAALTAHPTGAESNPVLLAEVKAPRVLMVEEATGTVLLSRKPDEPFAPGSIAKMMTVETILDALSKGEIDINKALPVTEFAWRTGGAPSRTTTMFAALRSNISVRDLLTGVVVQNANDGCIILAEGLSSTEQAFTERMNERAKALGLTGSRFGNSTGLPPAESRMTVSDMIRLGRHVLTAYPDTFALYAQADFEWNRIRQRNKNPLLGVVTGVDGFASGFAEEAGFSLMTTAVRGETRLYLAMSGLTTEKERQDEAARLIEWGFNGFTSLTIYVAGSGVGQATVYGGTVKQVPLAPQADVRVYAPTADLGRLSAQIAYRGPLRAPFDKGQEVGRIRIMIGDAILQEEPVYTAEAVEAGSLVSRAKDALWSLLFSWL